MDKPPLHLPKDQNFHCRSCGRCCRASWTIAVDPKAEEVIRQSRSYQELQAQGYEPLVVVDERLALGRRKCGACQFLQADGKCAIHSELGGNKKPIVCQIYPYLLTETPDGIFASMSFACPTVLENVGPPLEASRSEMEQLLAQRGMEVPRFAVAYERIEVLSGRFVSWSFYKTLEERILKAFSALRPVETLLAIAVHLVLADSKEDADDEVYYQALPSDLGGSNEELIGTFDQQLLCMVSCNLIAILEDVSAPLDRIRLGSLLWNGEPYYSSKLGVQLPAFTVRQPLHTQTIDLIDRYMRNAIIGKRLLSGTVVSRLLAFACGMAIILHYSSAMMEVAGGEYSLEAMDKSFTLLESELLSHTRSFDGFFQEFEQSLRKVRDTLHE